MAETLRYIEGDLMILDKSAIQQVLDLVDEIHTSIELALGYNRGLDDPLDPEEAAAFRERVVKAAALAEEPLKQEIDARLRSRRLVDDDMPNMDEDSSVDEGG